MLVMEDSFPNPAWNDCGGNVLTCGGAPSAGTLVPDAEGGMLDDDRAGGDSDGARAGGTLIGGVAAAGLAVAAPGAGCSAGSVAAAASARRAGRTDSNALAAARAAALGG
jgi:hypothetical protein